MAEYGHVAETADRWNPTKEGDQIEGVFEGFIAFDDTGSDVDPDTEGAFVYARIVEDGVAPLEVSASFQLRKSLSKVQPGTQVRITFLGTMEQKNPGRNAMKKYRVEW